MVPSGFVLFGMLRQNALGLKQPIRTVTSFHQCPAALTEEIWRDTTKCYLDCRAIIDQFERMEQSAGLFGPGTFFDQTTEA